MYDNHKNVLKKLIYILGKPINISGGDLFLDKQNYALFDEEDVNVIEEEHRGNIKIVNSTFSTLYNNPLSTIGLQKSFPDVVDGGESYAFGLTFGIPIQDSGLFYLSTKVNKLNDMYSATSIGLNTVAHCSYPIFLKIGDSNVTKSLFEKTKKAFEKYSEITKG
jgi:hypothetical protein